MHVDNGGRQLLLHGEPDTGKPVRPVRREVHGNLPPEGGKAPCSYSTRIYWVGATDPEVNRVVELD